MGVYKILLFIRKFLRILQTDHGQLCPIGLAWPMYEGYVLCMRVMSWSMSISISAVPLFTSEVRNGVGLLVAVEKNH